MPTAENLNSVKSLFNRHLHCTLAKDLKVATEHDFYLSFAYTVRDFEMERWKQTQDTYYLHDPKVDKYWVEAGLTRPAHLLPLDGVLHRPGHVQHHDQPADPPRLLRRAVRGTDGARVAGLTGRV